MTPDIRIDAEAVGALIVARDNPSNVFLGARHAKAKEISEKLAFQVSMFTETKFPGESDLDALRRLLFIEEVSISGFTEGDLLEGVKLSDVLLSTKAGNATLSTYLFQIDPDAYIQIIDHELEEVGWVDQELVLRSPRGSWWLRASLYEDLIDYRDWMCNPEIYTPRQHLNPRDRIPSEVFNLINQGISEEEALSQLGLHSSGQSRPWAFARLLTIPVAV